MLRAERAIAHCAAALRAPSECRSHLSGWRRCRKNAVQPDAGEQQRQQAEEAGECRQQAFSQYGLFDHGFESLEADADGGIDLGENALHRRDGLGLWQARPDQRLRAGPLSRVLRRRQVDDGDELLAQLAVLGVLDPTDDLETSLRVERRLFNPEAASDGISAVQEHTGEGFVHDGHVRGARVVALIEFAPSEESRAQSLEVIGAYAAAVGVPPLLRVRAVQPYVVARRVTAERNDGRVGCRFHSRNSPYPVEQLIPESQASFGWNIQPTEADLCDQDAFLPEACGRRQQLVQTAREEQCARHKHQRERYLRYHERPPQAESFASRR